MHNIDVYEIGVTERGWEFRVVVKDDKGSTKHHVSLDRDYWELLTGGRHNCDELVLRSFEFLLTREPKESILRAFNLRDIQRYFPEYGEEIKKHLP